MRLMTNPAHDTLPLDLLQPIIEQLGRAEWHACCLVSKAFCQAATPLLYRTLDSRVIGNKNADNSDNSNIVLYHPSTTLLSNPNLALHVKRVTETGAVHRGLLPGYSRITDDTLKALALCRNLSAFTWVDDTMYGPAMGALGSDGDTGEGLKTPGTFLMRFIELVRGDNQGNPESDHGLPLRSLTLRTHFDLGPSVWNSIHSIFGLTRVSIWSMEGPPRVLQGWAKSLGPSLEELELGRCTGVPPTILITVLSHLPLLQSLRMKGVQSNSILNILTYLPNLSSLDVEYLPSQTRLLPRDQARLVLLPSLRTLTIRINSKTDDPHRMYDWIRRLASKAGLEVFKLHASSYFSQSRSRSYNSFSFLDMGETLIPRAFILDLSRLHSTTLQRFEATEAGAMMMSDVECLCVSFPKLEVLECTVGVEGILSIHQAIRSARSLTTLKLHILWLPPSFHPSAGHPLKPKLEELEASNYTQDYRFTIADARSLMLRTDDSVLRTIGVGGFLYQGKWILSPSTSETLEFIVVSNIEES